MSFYRIRDLGTLDIEDWRLKPGTLVGRFTAPDDTSCYCHVPIGAEEDRIDRQVWGTYGVGWPFISSLFEVQEYQCALCLRAWLPRVPGILGNFVVDHDDYGVRGEWVRGLLCRGCNRRIGRPHDTSTWWDKLAERTRQEAEKRLLWADELEEEGTSGTALRWAANRLLQEGELYERTEYYLREGGPGMIGCSRWPISQCLAA